MTANHAHTPKALSTEFVRDMFEIAAVYAGYSENMEAATPHFNRWHSAEIAAAEQRGAIKALRDAAGAIEKNNIVFDGDHYQPCNSCRSIHMNWLDYRADQMEGDE